MKKKLAIVGASFGQKSLYLKAKEMGIETHCFAWDKKDAVCKELADYFYPVSVFEKEQILEICKKIQIDGICSIASDICVPSVWFVAEKMGLIGNKYVEPFVATNKFLMRQAFLKNGVNSPRFTIGDDKMDLSEFEFPLIVKPADRGGSIGVMKIEKREELKAAIERAQKVSYNNSAIVEEFVPGTESTLDMISWQGKHYPITISDTETTGAPYFSKIGYHEPSRLSPDIQDKIIQVAKNALNALNIKNGASDTEVKITDSGEIKVIEVNPRMGGDCTDTLVKLSTGYDFPKGVIDVALNQFEEPVFPINKFSGICYLSKETEYLKKIIENRENYPDIVQAEITDEELHFLQSSWERSGFLIYQSEKKRNWKP